MFSERRRFFMLALGIGTSASCGAVYAFSLLVPTLRGERCQFSVHQITLISSASTTVFGLIALPVGLLFDKFGPSVTLAISVIPQFIGWSLQAAAFHGSVPCNLFTVLLGNGLATMTVETATFLPMLANFALDQGSVVALQKTFYGLGASIFATCFNGFLRQNVVSYCIFLAILTSGTSMLSAVFIRNPSPEAKIVKAQPIRFRIGLLHEGLFIAFLAFVSFAGPYANFSQSQRDAFGIVSLVMLAMFLLMILPQEPQKDTSTQPLNHSNDVFATSEAPAHNKELNEEPLLVNMRGPDLWLKLAVTMGSIGASMMIIPNIDVIYKSLNQEEYTTTKSALYVAMTSVVNALARIAIGMLSYYVKHITILFLIPPIAAILSMGMILAHPTLLPVGFCLVGLSVGSCWASMILLAKATYSLRYIGQHYTFLFAACTLTPFPLGYWLFGSLYDQEAESQGRADLSCYGYACVSTALYTLLAINVLGVAAALWLHIRRVGRARDD